MRKISPGRFGRLRIDHNQPNHRQLDGRRPELRTHRVPTRRPRRRSRDQVPGAWIAPDNSTFRSRPETQISVGQVYVGVAHAACADPEQHLRSDRGGRKFDNLCQSSAEFREFVTAHLPSSIHDPTLQVLRLKAMIEFAVANAKIVAQIALAFEFALVENIPLTATTFRFQGERHQLNNFVLYLARRIRCWPARQAPRAMAGDPRVAVQAEVRLANA